MKTILLICVIVLNAIGYSANAQVNVNINIGRQPVWGPPGYDYVEYYYLPDYEFYYDVPRGIFVYFDLGRWNFGASLPARYGYCDLYHSYKVVINDRNPWLRHNYYHAHYLGYRGRRQPIIRDSHEERYFAGRERHWNNGRGNGYGNGRRNKGHGNWKGNKGHDDDHDRGRGQGHGKYQ